MALILHIDTSSEKSFVILSDNETVLHSETNEVSKNHAAFVQPAVEKLVNKTGIQLRDIDAVAVVAGPGSYTGLRVGLASAKGLCYALDKPLLMLNTLELIALGAKHSMAGLADNEEGLLFCPMIDARRMEVFTAVYDEMLQPLLNPQAMILDENAFGEYPPTKKLIFSGSGSQKFKNINKNSNAYFLEENYSEKSIIQLSCQLFNKYQFVNIAYAEPFYVKEFFTPIKKS
ncbi:tRNA (adenosine(37)-N6)-threonylcarbamoyltransferase complex dimerization subunit type 1 TsaB [Foetidibacter luteolus]|uniref:tRNA (adenosine(37)-N6)-threonylcarbamoyltransferase complex dimerization subunit type 1 TsaB n=1 Tax=Foetidibacter luteolus TaxID=2608880 RepID=UPI00129B45F6|nr:tRNA (adenosine(37)-N6)-threonylcarbamoyltransferase complex dimerization subunit type 1 TsaB [Foetidibacter luteolus]